MALAVTSSSFKPTFGRTTSQYLEEAESVPESDINFGAYLISHFRQYCENCQACETPQWRKGWYSEMLGRSVLLCNACGLKYHKNQYCYHCHFIYGKEQEKLIGLEQDDWVSCKTRSWSEGYTCPSCIQPPVNALGQITFRFRPVEHKRKTETPKMNGKRRKNDPTWNN
ncbi:hypothetical protein PROFUN_03486 [Planoprotostelium fungivorum]|uniref:GATA-type domain-containing protein n=1 Tax=Planoprotostelium fungivorum TaxID=1890364 RepID=A0A2P6MNB2_9EUKA|nr:hypothetical protein PROFUN_03486 [Planoprotostelium fungivorum]